MEYNTQRKALHLPEYGRNVHKMVELAMSVKDSEKRNRMAKGIIALMGQMYPHLRDVPDFKHKLWDHLFIMSDYKLDVESPYPKPLPEEAAPKVKRLPYPDHRFSHKHYGKIIRKMVEKAIDYKEGEEKEMLTKALANHMKKQYLTWKKESVTDDIIVKDLQEFSGGKLKLKEGVQLHDVSTILAANQRKRFHGKTPTVPPPRGRRRPR